MHDRGGYVRRKNVGVLLGLAVLFFGIALWSGWLNVKADNWKGEPIKKLTIVVPFEPNNTFVVEEVEPQLLFDLKIRKVMVRCERDNRKFSAFAILPREVSIGNKVKLLELSYVTNSINGREQSLLVIK